VALNKDDRFAGDRRRADQPASRISFLDNSVTIEPQSRKTIRPGFTSQYRKVAKRLAQKPSGMSTNEKGTLQKIEEM